MNISVSIRAVRVCVPPRCHKFQRHGFLRHEHSRTGRSISFLDENKSPIQRVPVRVKNTHIPNHRKAAAELRRFDCPLEFFISSAALVFLVARMRFEDLRFTFLRLERHLSGLARTRDTQSVAKYHWKRLRRRRFLNRKSAKMHRSRWSTWTVAQVGLNRDYEVL